MYLNAIFKHLLGLAFFLFISKNLAEIKKIMLYFILCKAVKIPNFSNVYIYLHKSVLRTD